MTNFADLQALAKDNFDKQMAAFAELQKGAQSVIGEVNDYSKKAFEANTAVLHKLSAVKNLETALDIQSEFTKAAYENLVHHLTKIGAIVTDATKDAYKPIEAAVTRGK